MHHYTECGLDNVFLDNGYNIIQDKEDEYISFNNLDGMHIAIATAICNQKYWLSSDQFKFLRKELDLSQSSLGNLLFCDRQTIARWEKGECPITHTQDVLLRAIYLESINQDIGVTKMIKLLLSSEGTKEIKNHTLRQEECGSWSLCHTPCPNID